MPDSNDLIDDLIRHGVTQSEGITRPRFMPADCPHCAYDRRFPGLEMGGWLQQDNNGPIVSCPLCNDDGKHPRDWKE
jgi:hypothetical protein